MNILGELMLTEYIDDALALAGVDLHNRTKLFVEKSRDVISAERGKIDVQAATAGKRHFTQGGKNTAVGAVMISEQQFFVIELEQHL